MATLVPRNANETRVAPVVESGGVYIWRESGVGGQCYVDAFWNLSLVVVKMFPHLICIKINFIKYFQRDLQKIVSLKMAVFRVVAPCSLKRWQTSTRLHGATTQKTAIFVLTAVRTSNPISLYHCSKGPFPSTLTGYTTTLVKTNMKYDVVLAYRTLTATFLVVRELYVLLSLLQCSGRI
jgi:hypothetical protein